MDDLHMLPRQPLGSFETFASTIESTKDVQIEAGSDNSADGTQRAIATINRAITRRERVDALRLALSMFSHDDVDMHNHEVNLGVDKALCLKLGYVVVASPAPLEEIDLVGQCLLQVYQCSPEQRKRSFRNVGGPELVPLLIQILMTGMLSMVKVLAMDEKSVLLTVVKVLRVYSKLECAKSTLIRLNRGQWVGEVLQYSVNQIRSDDPTLDALSLEVLGLIKDLTFRSLLCDKMTVLSTRGGIFGGLLASICSNFHNIESQTVEWFTAVVWNMVLDKDTCDQIMESERLHGFPIIHILLRILRMEDVYERRDHPAAGKIRRNATSSIGNILAHPNYRVILLCHLTREQLPILSTLMKLAECDKDPIVRRRAMRTLRCVLSSGTATIPDFIESENIASFLAEMISKDISVDDDNDRDSQIQACQAVAAMVDHIADSVWPRIETALLQRVETSNDKNLIQAACSCLAECIRRSPWCRGASCFSEMFWARVEAASTLDAAHPAIAAFLFELTRVEKKGESKTAPDQPSSLVCTPVVKILTNLLSSPSAKQEGSRKLAVDAVVILAEKDANKRPLAENESLLASLVNLCLMQPEGDSKNIAKKVIIELVPEL